MDRRSRKRAVMREKRAGTCTHPFINTQTAPATLLYVTTDEPNEREPSSRPWSGAKSKLSFCRVTQDGDWEGCLYLDRLPAPHEAAAIRETLGIRKRRTITDEARAQLEANLKSTKSPKLDPPVRQNDFGAPDEGSLSTAPIPPLRRIWEDIQCDRTQACGIIRIPRSAVRKITNL
jgi:hypothetical protein